MKFKNHETYKKTLRIIKRRPELAPHYLLNRKNANDSQMNASLDLCQERHGRGSQHSQSLVFDRTANIKELDF